MIEWFGIFAIILCIFGRTWTSLYIGGRKNRALLTKGPYSVVRNPLYVFSILGAAGAGAQLGSVISSVIIGLLVTANNITRRTQRRIGKDIADLRARGRRKRDRCSG